MFAYPVPVGVLEGLPEGVDAEAHHFGPRTAALERDMAALCGVSRAIAVASGRAGLRLALGACALQAGDEVIMPANVFPAVLDAVLLLGGTPVLVDVEEDTGNIDTARASLAVTPRTRAMVVQHTFGHPVDMDPLLDLRRRFDFRILEDAAHALGARYRGRPVGGLGDIAVFAFSNKGISGCGAGGTVVTSEDTLADNIVQSRFRGRRDELSLTEFVAEVASFQLGLLENWNLRRRTNASRYLERLAGLDLPIRPQAVRPYAHHAYLHVAIRLRDRNALRLHLARRGIDARVQYYTPAYLGRTIRNSVPYRLGDFPLAEALWKESLSLPAHPGLREAEIDYVVDEIAAFFRTTTAALG
jgi:dTDP-3-amino-3,4,6-trideoxy-alpha-D-glucose transaminase